MSGYFSRIAKQSGVRFLKGGESGGRVMKNRTELPGPLDRDETVMMSRDERTIGSVLRSSDKPLAPESARRDAASPHEGQRQHRRSLTKSVETAYDRRFPLTTESSPAEPAVEELRLVESDRPGSPAVRTESPAAAFSEDTGDAIPHEPSSETRKPSAKEKRQTDTANSETPDKDFFEKTSEILQGRDAEPSAVQTILIREVQEWIAAGRLPTDDAIPDVDADRERQQPDETRANVERTPGVIRIGDRKPPDISSDPVQELTPSRTELSEQNFEISIGSISVVIDGEEPAAQPAPTAAPPSASSSAAPRTSRLSRHYL